ncbi:hypothetical protein AAFF_G00345300 [Aldrovandia affinis]|uniref:Uncharacterized protein n=1 Tax=Aldrovandia affinis TaxID=143900 RepID=A0AAD7R621_9TELE|nr:hypothetical protein AAFF_G00345300 [Aldrovandia affinis]
MAEQQHFLLSDTKAFSPQNFMKGAIVVFRPATFLCGPEYLRSQGRGGDTSLRRTLLLDPRGPSFQGSDTLVLLRVRMGLRRVGTVSAGQPRSRAHGAGPCVCVTLLSGDPAV